MAAQRVVDTSAWIEWLTDSALGAKLGKQFPDRARARGAAGPPAPSVQSPRMSRLKLQTAVLLASPDDAEAQFYEALQQGDIERMMAVWSDEDEVACVHPGGARLIGPQAVRTAFEALFAQGGVDASVHQVRRLVLGPCAVHHVLERVRVSAEDGAPYGFMVATNVYAQTPMGWRMLLHHASPGQARELQALIEAPTGVLH